MVVLHHRLTRAAIAIGLAGVAIGFRLMLERIAVLQPTFAFPFVAIAAAGLWLGTAYALLTAAVTMGVTLWLLPEEGLDATFVLLAASAAVMAVMTGHHRKAVMRERVRSKTVEERFRTMADGLPHPVWVHDADGSVAFVNRTYREYFNVTEDDVHGMRWLRLLHPDDREAYAAEFLRCVEQRVPFHRRTRVRRADGQWRWVETWGRPRLGPGGEFNGFVGVSPDITERYAQEAELAAAHEALARANRELEQFAAVAGHDLRQPIRGMCLLAEFVLEDDRAALSRESVERLRRIETVGRRLIAMIEGLLEYARSGGRLHPEPCGLDAVVRRAVDSLREAVQDAGATVAVQMRLPTVHGDPALLERAISNLIANGLKYNNARTPRVEIGWKDGELFVRDNGIGIDPRQQESIFGLFTRGRATRGIEGVGLGLPFVKRIAEAHGGGVRLESAPGRGSTFYIRLPVEGAAGFRGAEPAAGERRAAGPPPRRIPGEDL